MRPGTSGKSPLHSKSPSNSNIQRPGITSSSWLPWNLGSWTISTSWPLPLWPSAVPSTHQAHSPSQSLCNHSSPHLEHASPGPSHTGSLSSFRSQLKCHLNPITQYILFSYSYQLLKFLFSWFLPSFSTKHTFHESLNALRIVSGTYSFSIIMCWKNECS